METSDISILVVDDSESAMNVVEQILFNADSVNLHFSKGSVDALQFLEDTPIQILLTEWDLQDLDGLELAVHVKEMNEKRSHYTYTIVFSDREPDDHLKEAFLTSVDAFLRKKDLHSYLPGMIQAAGRMTRKIGRLISQNIELNLEAESLQAGQLLDPLTGLGNQKMAEQKLTDTIKQIEDRGGVACYLLIGIGNYEELVLHKSLRVAHELIVAIAKRLANLIRPLDVATYLGNGRFALILLQPTIDQCTKECYRRIHEGIGLKSYMTTAGYISISIATCICAAEALMGPPNPKTMMELAESDLAEAYITEEIQVRLLGVDNN